MDPKANIDFAVCRGLLYDDLFVSTTPYLHRFFESLTYGPDMVKRIDVPFGPFSRFLFVERGPPDASIMTAQSGLIGVLTETSSSKNLKQR